MDLVLKTMIFLLKTMICVLNMMIWMGISRLMIKEKILSQLTTGKAATNMRRAFQAVDLDGGGDRLYSTR